MLENKLTHIDLFSGILSGDLVLQPNRLDLRQSSSVK